jgi:hypothetical protein
MPGEKKKRGPGDPHAARRAEGFDLWLMSNLRPKDTGVEGAVIWFSAGEFADDERQRGPRLEVVLGDTLAAEGLKRAVSVRLTTPPEVLGELPDGVARHVVDFVEKNRDALLRHWDGEIFTGDVCRLLKRV